MDRTKFIALRRTDIIKRLGRGEEFNEAAQLLHNCMQYDAEATSEQVRAAYAPFDPDPLYPNHRGDAPGFLARFERMMEDANFRRISDAELQAAFEEKSIFPLHATVDLDDYEIMQLYRRGVVQKTERIRSLATLYRWRDRQLTVYERLVVVLRLKETALSGKRTARMSGMEPGKIYLKSFKNIPTADIEMVLPNTRLRMRRLDRVLVGGPLVAGVGATIVNSIGIFLAIAAGAFVLSLDDPQVRAFGGVLLVLAGYLWKTHSKIKTTRMQYLQTLSTGLYFRNLANNAAVIDQTLGFAHEAEEKEALLAYAMLQGGKQTRKSLDAKCESWLLEQTGRASDFDVADGLSSLRELGLAKRHLGRWHALSPVEAKATLNRRWDNLF